MLDTYTEHSPINPVNQKEFPELTNQEQLEEWAQGLKRKNLETIRLIKEFGDYPNYLLIELKKLYKL